MFWPARRTLFVADLHWGKRETFVVEGIPLPDGLLTEELERLRILCARTRAVRVVVLGDLIHSRSGITDAVVKEVARFRQEGPEFVLIRGNHDRHLPALPKSWCIEERGDSMEAPFVLTHVPREDPAGYVLAGHIHPAVRLRGRGDGVRLPCFHIGPRCTVLPAFSEFTGGAQIARGPGDRVVAIAESTLIEV